MKPTYWLRVLVFMVLAAPLPAQTSFGDLMSQGNKLYFKKDYSKALQVYQKAVQLDPNSAAIYQAIGNCQYVLGQKNEAVDSYQKSLQINPDNPSIARIVKILRPNATPLPTLKPESTPTSVPNTPTPQATQPPPGPKAIYHPGLFLELGGGGIVGAQHSTPACIPLRFGLDLGAHWSLLADGTFSWAHFNAIDWPVTGQNQVSTYDFRFLGGIKWTPGGEVLQPYGLIEGGIRMDTIASGDNVLGSPKFPNITSSDPDVAIGLGVETLGDAGFFVEMQVNGVITSGGLTTNYPFTTGLRFNL